MESDNQQIIKKRHPKISVVSLASSSVAFLLFVMFLLLEFLKYVGIELPEQSKVYYLAPLVPLLLLVGISAAITSLCLKNRNKSFAWSGLIIGVFSVFLLFVSFVMAFCFSR